MDKIARVRQEIERRMKIYKESNYGISLRYQELEELLAFLDTLPEEPEVDVTDFCKSIDPGIAQCIADHWHEMLGEVDEHPKNILPPSKECDHGLREPLESEEPDKSLEEDIKNYFQGYFPGTETVEQCNTDLHFTPPAIIRLARHFAEWGAKHLRDSTKMIDRSLEEAADGKVNQDGILELSNGEAIDVCPSLDKCALGLQLGEKVKLIIVKDNDTE